MRNKPLFNDKNIEPTKDEIKSVLKDSYTVFEELSEILTSEKYSLTMNFNFHKNIIDTNTNAWYFRVVNKKKTIFWLSFCENYFVITFFFLTRHLEDIGNLGANDDSFVIGKEFWRDPKVIYIPLTFEINSKEQIADLLKVVKFRIKSK
jgi:hypothetical protein